MNIIDSRLKVLEERKTGLDRTTTLWTVELTNEEYNAVKTLIESDIDY